MTDKTPYQQAAPTLFTSGWWPLPLAPHSKTAPPAGTTGKTGREITVDEVLQTLTDPTASNVAIRLPKHVVGIDVDAYGEKNGAATLTDLENKHGELPPTVTLTARNDGVSGIRLYKLPKGVDEERFIGGFDGIDIIRFSHRYALAPPSIHPSGSVYRAIYKDRTEGINLPHPDELPELPAAWCKALQQEQPIDTSTPTPAATTYPCKVAANWLQEATTELTRSGRARHDVATSQALKAVRLIDFGHQLFDELDTFANLFINAISKDRQGGQRTAEHEWASILNTAYEKISLDPSTEPKSCCGPRQYEQLASFTPLIPEPDASEHSSWHPLTLDEYLDGTHITVLPTILSRVDGNSLLYAGKVASIYGESESGKSWLCQWACADELNKGNSVIYIDFESDPLDLTQRLQLLGVNKETIRTHFRYIRPEAPPHPLDPAWTSLLAFDGTLVVIDGVTEALTLWNKASKENDDITIWMRHFPRAIARATGAAVVLVDHVAKDRETRGRFQIGGQAKLASIDGSAFLVEPLDALAPGRTGKLSIRVTKDRPGSVRRIGGQWRKNDRTQEVAVAIINAEQANNITVTLCVPDTQEDIETAKRESLTDAILEVVAKHPGCTRGDLARGLRAAKVTYTESELTPHVKDLLADGVLDNAGSEAQWKLVLPTYMRPNSEGERGLENAS